MFMKSIVPCLMCIVVSPIFAADNGSKILVNDLIKHWQTSKSLSLAVADAMLAEGYQPFKPSGGEWNFADQMGSLALANVLSCTSAFHTKAPQRFQSALDRPMDHTKDGTMESLRVAYDYCIDGLGQMDDSSLFEVAAISGHRATKFDILWNAIAHATHRLGLAEMYLRSKGITPPYTGPKYEF
jgi:hypothetical protein